MTGSLQRIAVLASGSFSGSHFVDFCLSQGVEVLGLSRSKETSAAFLPYLNNPKRKNFRFLQLNLNSDLERIKSELSDFQPEGVIDFAGQGMVAQSWNHPEQWFETNVLSKVKLHEHLRQMKSLKRYLRFSTPEVYGSTSGLVKEDAPMNPSTPYAVSHAAIDMSLMAYHKRYGFPVTLTRASNVYGVGQQLYRIIPRAILSAKTGKKLVLDGGGVSIRNFVEISDVSDALWKLIHSSQSVGQVYHISSDEYVSIRQLVEMISSMTGVPFAKFVEVGAERPGKDLIYQIDSTRLRQQEGWAPQFDLKTGLQKVVSWVDANLRELENLSWDYTHKH